MANTANTNLKTITQRNSKSLAIQATPHCETVGDARVLGFVKKGVNVPGVWIVREEKGRTATGAPIRVRAKLGLSCILADEADANPAAGVLSYEQARALAVSHIFADPNAPVVRAGFTVADAVEQHRDYGGKKGNKTERAKLAAYNSLRHNVIRKGLGTVVVNNLTVDQLQALRDSWIADSCEATALRNWTNLHSCLEQAAKTKANGITNTAWRDLAKLGQDFEGRQLHFTNDEALAIIVAARAIDADVADYFEALFRTGCRPGGELLDRTVGDYIASTRRIAIPARTEVNRSKTGKRNVSLDAQGVALFARLSAGKASTAPLLTPCDERGRVKAVMVKAVQSVLPEVKAEDIVPYAFRHTFISRRLEAGMPMSLVAVHCGTSEYMISKTYAKFCPSETERWLTETAPQPVLQVVRNAA